MIIDPETGGMTDVVRNPITSLFIASASEDGIKWMADNNIGTNPLAPNILFWTTEEQLQAMVQVAEWHRKYGLNYGISIGHMDFLQPSSEWLPLIAKNIEKIYSLGIFPSGSGMDTWYIDAETAALPVRIGDYIDLYAPVINQIWDSHVPSRSAMVVMSPFITKFDWSVWEWEKQPYFVHRDQERFFDGLAEAVTLDSRDLYLTYAVQDGVGTSLYPGNREEWDQREVGTSDYERFLRILDALYVHHDKIYSRVNMELFGVDENGIPNGIATKERLLAQMLNEYEYSKLGLGPCWVWDEFGVGFSGYNNQKFRDFYQNRPGSRNPPADFDDDGKTDITIWRPENSFWHIINSSNGNKIYTQWGTEGDIPVPGDYDGDGKTDIAVWRPANGYWYIIRSSDGSKRYTQWGEGGLNDIPVPGDYDGDGKSDIVVWRPSNGYWYIINSSAQNVDYVQWGTEGDIPVPGDYDGDGKNDIVVWRPSNGYWYIIKSSDQSVGYVQWGGEGDIPVRGDYDGDGKTDIAVWRPSNGYWYIINSSDGSQTHIPWGGEGDVPITQ